MPHSFEYMKNANGVHILSTTGLIVVENTDNTLVLGNLAIVCTGADDAPVLNFIFEEVDLKGRVGKLLGRSNARLIVLLSNGETFICNYENCRIKKGYGSWGESVDLYCQATSLISSNSPDTPVARAKYALKQLSAYDITKVMADDHIFIVKGTEEDENKLMRSAAVFAGMTDKLREVFPTGIYYGTNAFVAGEENVQQPVPKVQDTPVEATDNSEVIPYSIVEKKPTFEGKDPLAFQKWVMMGLRYPEIAKENGVQGRVTMQIIIEADGSISNITVLRGVDSSLDKEALRVVSNSPQWEPGMQNGKPVRVKYTFPVVFQLR